ncbi:hypothetical protein M2132_000557 [Dysgonomonas sp. PH5-45]|uniref:immunity protein Imm33 domain-containing protein n=1 Tax=unclassified Dysgonomonas TaxID=2630389 RepID=UPI002474FBDC|nr:MULTISPECIES: DUF2185 domain-containing protein [unclassified Dysgonomonas]MDH6354230.1 hypothetical protein [Dysgonomonas sp. PH5-45]MDH6387131.1 hypothetical protein [Dysgonomonas sp. PH5-37]
MQSDENWDDPSIQEFDEMQKYAFVTQRALDNDFIGYCYREYSDIKIDSGWRFMHGDEEEDYLENPENTETRDLSEVLAWKPQLKDILSAKRNTEFEWDIQTNSFIEITE